MLPMTVTANQQARMLTRPSRQGEGNPHHIPSFVCTHLQVETDHCSKQRDQFQQNKTCLHAARWHQPDLTKTVCNFLVGQYFKVKVCLTPRTFSKLFLTHEEASEKYRKNTSIYFLSYCHCSWKVTHFHIIDLCVTQEVVLAAICHISQQMAVCAGIIQSRMVSFRAPRPQPERFY